MESNDSQHSLERSESIDASDSLPDLEPVVNSATEKSEESKKDSVLQEKVINGSGKGDGLASLHHLPERTSSEDGMVGGQKTSKKSKKRKNKKAKQLANISAGGGEADGAESPRVSSGGDVSGESSPEVAKASKHGNMKERDERTNRGESVEVNGDSSGIGGGHAANDKLIEEMEKNENKKNGEKPKLIEEVKEDENVKVEKQDTLLSWDDGPKGAPQCAVVLTNDVMFNLDMD